MIRLFVYLAIVLALGFGFSWIADHPGVVTLNWQGQDIRTSLMVVVVAIVVLVASLLFIWALLRGVIGLPLVVSKFFSNRRRDHGYQALSKGLIAAGTGDKALARRLAKESGKLLTNEPLVDLLDAQTSLLEGNREAARGRFQAMLENDDTKLLGLRGLYLEAEREGAREASRQYAQEAVALSPTLAWAGNAKLRNLSMDGDWEGALKTLEANRSSGLVDKVKAKRQRAVLLTARAMAEEPANPDLAAKLASEAHRLAPDLVAAAVTGAGAYARSNNLRKASKMLETVWKKSPQPELADAYIHLRVGDTAGDRLKRAKTLAKLRNNHPIANMAIAEAAIDAKDWPRARDAMKSVIVDNLTERSCLIMADIEEGEHGDAGRMRDWLSRAVRAPRDAKWTAGGFTSESWLPISPVTGELDAFEWKVPVEQLQISSESIDIGDLAEPLKPLPIVAVGVDELGKNVVQPTQNPDEGGDLEVEQNAAIIVAVASEIETSKVGKPETVIESDKEEDKDNIEDAEQANPQIKEAKIVELVLPGKKIAANSNDDQQTKEADKLDDAGEQKSQSANKSVENKNVKDKEPKEAVFALERRPDDPGVEEEKTISGKGL